ncbi:MAG: hypothetical protein AAF587_32605 [Bacteroidota bacterium]
MKNDEKSRIITIEDQTYTSESLFHLLHIQEGDSLGIIMDHAASEDNHNKIRHHFFNCRQVFIESFYKEEDKEQARINDHSYSTMSARVMRVCRVRHPIPVHFSRKYNEDEIKELISEFDSEMRKKTDAKKS